MLLQMTIKVGLGFGVGRPERRVLYGTSVGAIQSTQVAMFMCILREYRRTYGMLVQGSGREYEMGGEKKGTGGREGEGEGERERAGRGREGKTKRVAMGCKRGRKRRGREGGREVRQRGEGA
jgi:hypothetical protein